MAIEQVKAYLAQYHMADAVRELEQSSATVALAAQALGCEEARIAKTLSFYAKEGTARLVVAAGDQKIDGAKYKQTFGEKPKMLKAEGVEAMVGHSPGGVCPFAVKDGVKVYLDQSLQRFTTVFPACGSSNSAIEMTMAQLEQCAQTTAWVDVCKAKEPIVQE